jgi:hypothetical protein
VVEPFSQRIFMSRSSASVRLGDFFLGKVALSIY